MRLTPNFRHNEAFSSDTVAGLHSMLQAVAFVNRTDVRDELFGSTSDAPLGGLVDNGRVERAEREPARPSLHGSSREDEF